MASLNRSSQENIETSRDQPHTKFRQKYKISGPFKLLNSFETDLIFSYFNILDLIILTRVCKSWNHTIEQDPYIIKDLQLIPTKINSLNLMKILSRGKYVNKLVLPDYSTISDSLTILICVNKHLTHITINNMNIDIRSVFNQNIPFLKTLELINLSNRTKKLDELETKALQKNCSTIENLVMKKNPINDQILNDLTVSFKNLRSLVLLEQPQLKNQSLEAIANNCEVLKNLTIGGSYNDYNHQISIDGIQKLVDSSLELNEITLEYISKIGNECMTLIFKKYATNLKKFKIQRNCFEKCAVISDEGLKALQYACNLENLEIIYTRKFRTNFHLYISKNLSNLKYLNLRDCPLQEDLNVLIKGCPQLIEVDISGDSWVKTCSLMGLSKHPKLRILRLGHFEHSDSSCDENLQDNPPDGLFIESVFQKKENFPSLNSLFLEQECSLTYWLDVRIRRIRPNLNINYTPNQRIFAKF